MIKSFSIGINPKFEIQDFCNILKKYQNYIDSIYTSPPIKLQSNHSITSRHFLQDLAGSQMYANYNDYVCEYAKDLNIKIDMAINGLELTNNDLDEIINYLIIKKPDEITLLNIYKDFFKINYPFKTFYIYSYNSSRPEEKEFQDPFWDSYAISNEFFWNKTIWPGLNKELRFILNTGCPAGGPPCVNTINKTACKNNCITRYKNPEKFLAYHSWFGTDLKLFEEKNISRKYKYKLTTRNRMCDIESLDWYLYCLINNIDISDIKLQENNYKSFIWFCFAPFWTLHSKEVQKMSIEKLRKEKENLWEDKFIGNKINQNNNSNNNNKIIYKPTLEDNDKLIKIFLNQKEFLTEIEQSILNYYNLKYLKINQKFIIMTNLNNIILEDINNINYKINYIDMALKKDKRYLYKIELNKLSMYTFGEYKYKNTFQGKEQKAINGKLQKQYYILKELKYQKEEALKNSDIFQNRLIKEANFETKEDIDSNKLSIIWNKKLNNEKLKNNEKNLRYFQRT